jgi:Pyruvate/2-oxoacid:ferredoxin oxidoreductase delta subunit
MAYKNIDDYKEKTTKFSTDNRCPGCMICKNSCPRRNIEIIDNKPAFGGKCVLCTRCINICPENAILYDGVMRKQYKGLIKAFKKLYGMPPREFRRNRSDITLMSSRNKITSKLSMAA